jgi:hypothetical protein
LALFSLSSTRGENVSDFLDEKVAKSLVRRLNSKSKLILGALFLNEHSNMMALSVLSIHASSLFLNFDDGQVEQRSQGANYDRDRGADRCSLESGTELGLKKLDEALLVHRSLDDEATGSQVQAEVLGNMVGSISLSLINSVLEIEFVSKN